MLETQGLPGAASDGLSWDWTRRASCWLNPSSELGLQLWSEQTFLGVDKVRKEEVGWQTVCGPEFVPLVLGTKCINALPFTSALVVWLTSVASV